MPRLLLLLVLALGVWASGCGSDTDSSLVVGPGPSVVAPAASPSVVTLRLDFGASSALGMTETFTVEVFPAPNGPLLLDLDAIERSPATATTQEVKINGLPAGSLVMRVVFFEPGGDELGYQDQTFVNEGSPVVTINSLIPTLVPPNAPTPPASPSPAPAASPSPLSSPSPGSTPSPVASPSPTASPTPGLSLQPGQVTLSGPLATQRFTLLAGNQDVTSRATWSSSRPDVAVVTVVGVATAVSAGTTIVTATVDGQQTQATLSVTGATLQGLSIAPNAFTLGVPERAQFTASGQYSDGVSRDLTLQVDWSSSPEAVFAVDNHGLVIARTNGSGVLTAGSGNVSAQIQGTVSPRATPAPPAPTPVPSVSPTPVPSPSPTPVPSPSPTPVPSVSPTPVPSPSPVLRLTGLSPASGPTAGGNSVTLTGNTLTGVTSVTFGGASIPFTISSDTQLEVIAPAGTGAVNVTATSSAGTATLSYGYDLPAITGAHTINPSANTYDGAPVAGLSNGQWNVGSFNLAAGATLTVTGSQPLVINSTNAVQIDGAILARGGAGANAVRAVPGAGGTAGPGGFAGGRGGNAVPNGALAGGGPGGGGLGTGTPVNSGGGGGGGHNGAGQVGGGLASFAGAAGAAYGVNDIPTVLVGGSGGGGGGRSSGAFTQGGGGGGGGGVVRVLGSTIRVTGTIDVRGGAGGNGTTPPSGNGASGGGGGAGGSVWLSAGVTPTISPGTVLLTGGAGGALIITGPPFTAGDGGAGAQGTLVLQP